MYLREMWGKFWHVGLSTFHVHCSSCCLYILMLYEKSSRSQVTHRRCCTSIHDANRLCQADFSASTWMAGFSSAHGFSRNKLYISKPKTDVHPVLNSFTLEWVIEITAMHDCFDKESVTKRKSSYDKYVAVLVLLAVQYSSGWWWTVCASEVENNNEL